MLLDSWSITKINVNYHDDDHFMKISFGFATHFLILKRKWMQISNDYYIVCVNIYKTFTKVWFKSVLPIDAVTWTFCKHNIKTLKFTKPNISLWKRRQSLEPQLFTQSINAAMDALELCVPWTYSHLFQNQMLHGNILSFMVHAYDTLVSRYCVKQI